MYTICPCIKNKSVPELLSDKHESEWRSQDFEISFRFCLCTGLLRKSFVLKSILRCCVFRQKSFKCSDNAILTSEVHEQHMKNNEKCTATLHGCWKWTRIACMCTYICTCTYPDPWRTVMCTTTVPLCTIIIGQAYFSVSANARYRQTKKSHDGTCMISRIYRYSDSYSKK